MNSCATHASLTDAQTMSSTPASFSSCLRDLYSGKCLLLHTLV